TVSVLSVDETGAAKIKGSRTVTVDGRPQAITLEGKVRAEDVDASNRVLSGRIADAVITYKGQKIGPRTGIIGKVLGMLWPSDGPSCWQVVSCSPRSRSPRRPASRASPS